MHFSAVRWEELFYLMLAFLLVGINLAVLIYHFKRHRFDDLECSKYNVFTNDPFPRDIPEPEPPAYCQLKYPRNPSLRGGFGTEVRWVWIIFALWMSWLGIILAYFLRSHWFL